ncbi:MAG: zinc-ribbon domain-containing protein [Clostridia bacterium]|nr:zinc-ribbon domain-containing protein [Clostridia bacterium]
MVCSKCGRYIGENSRVCPYCGQPIDGEERNITAATTHAGPMGNPTPTLVWGILGLSFSLTFYLSFLGIIFSAVGLHKAKVYNQFTNFAPSNQVRHGRRLAIAGLIVGIILTVLCAIFIILLITEASSSSYSSSYWYNNRYYY